MNMKDKDYKAELECMTPFQRMKDERILWMSKSVHCSHGVALELLPALVAERDYAESLEALRQAKCTWTHEGAWGDDCWEGTCGATWYFSVGGPDENDMKFCPQCGNNLVQSTQSS
jgi:hypothetical protein